jgi:hypothetical protein
VRVLFGTLALKWLVQNVFDSFALWQDSPSLTLSLEDARRLAGFLNGDMFVASGQLTVA